MNYEKIIENRLNSVLSDPELFPYCLEAYAAALAGMGLSNPKVSARKVMDFLNSHKTLIEREKDVWNYFKTLSVDRKSFEEHVASLISDRRKTMLEQINPFLLPEGKAADFGAGNGEFMCLVSSQFPKLTIDGWDVVTDDPKGNVQTYDGMRIPRNDGFYNQVYATTVLHHLENPKVGAKEIVRVSNKRIILIETIAGTRTGDRAKDWNITFAVDYFWRLIHKSSEPVPGSYLTVFEWIELFVQQLGCTLSVFRDFGSDQKTMTEKHVLFVFEK